MIDVVPLGEDALGVLATRGVRVPTYDRAVLEPRILHIGVGGFHRSHLALYTDDAAERGGSWAINGVGLLEADRRIWSALRAQDWFYTLVERGRRTTVRVVGSIIGFDFVPEDVQALHRRLANPDVRILSLTITEAGYADSAPNPTFEAIASALEQRRRTTGAPLTILSCDNLPGNGDAARRALTAAADRRGAALGHYIEQACTFPNSMVDRITPQTSDDDRAWLREQRGIDDASPVVCEEFRQWVIEDDFAAGRPRWEELGAVITGDVRPWELYKLRMLNAGHSVLAYVAALTGLTYVDEAVADPSLRGFLERFLDREAMPTLEVIPALSPTAYARSVVERFGNVGIRDQIARICMDGTAKMPSFLIPTVERQLESGGEISCSVVALAAWCRYLEVTPADRRASDAGGDEAQMLAAQASADPLRFLELDAVFTPRLRASQRFRESFLAAHRSIAADGAHATVRRILAEA